MHWRGIEPRSPAWQARILPLNHQCLLNHARPKAPISKVKKFFQKAKFPQKVNCAELPTTGNCKYVVNACFYALISPFHIGIAYFVKSPALAGNRTPVSRVAGENSTTEPTMLDSLRSLTGPNRAHHYNTSSCTPER